MSVYQTKEFAKFARKAKLDSADLLAAAVDVAQGRWDASLGGGVFKQRIGRKGGGKSSGFRTIIVCKMGAHSFFVHGFAKNQKANVSPKELEALKKLATVLLALDVGALETAMAVGEISEVTGRS
ncbi:type II toxin-antitoxin system RelE/ParE family toxin [Rhodopseudomonas palustris]|uniref:Type II toxin-antitoxin system RelE/ParE family toxin n=1 Tax=Rhodopseudomonas palustris TaxID=1076 RepID=A0A323UJI9_RHOPL|nr:type II toxin-antitoxin system RelE/ParE family toxin [Rhodopseudomonas palustris]PZA12664.1 type II toxin-antitoxin system RelE/ParE family toxin [Rhodopseudomonas palustris]